MRRLWRGEALRTPDGEGRPIEVRILPQPVQPELPEWVATGSTFIRAGQVTRIVDSIEAALREGDRLEEIACRVALGDALAAIEVLHGG